MLKKSDIESWHIALTDSEGGLSTSKFKYMREFVSENR